MIVIPIAQPYARPTHLRPSAEPLGSAHGAQEWGRFCGRVQVESLAPPEKFNHIESPLTGLNLGDPTWRNAECRGQRSLGLASGFAHLDQAMD